MMQGKEKNKQQQQLATVQWNIKQQQQQKKYVKDKIYILGIVLINSGSDSF